MKTILLTRVLTMLLLLSGFFATFSSAQRTWHLLGDSTGSTDYIGTNNTRDLLIKTDSTTRITVRSGGEVVIEGNIIDSTGSLWIDSIRTRIIHVGDSSLFIGGSNQGAGNYVLSNDVNPIVLGHTTGAFGAAGNNIWNANVGIGIAAPQVKLHLNTFSTTGTPNDCFELFTNGHNGWNNPQPTLGFRIGLASNKNAELRQRHPNEMNF